MQAPKNFLELADKTGAPSDYDTLEGYYDGSESLDSLGLSIPPYAQMLEVIAPFAKISIDVLAEVITPTGFIMGDNREIPDLLQSWWQFNNLDSESDLAIVEALVQGAAYWVIGYGDDNHPRITAHSRQGVATRLDRHGDVAEAVLTWKVDDVLYAHHYVPGAVVPYINEHADWRPDPDAEIIETGIDTPTIVPMFNKARLSDLRGRSELYEVVKLNDAASRTLTGLQLATETVSLPQRYLFNDAVASALRTNPDGTDVPQVTQAARLFETYTTSLWVAGKDSEAGSIPGADLQQLHNSYKLFAQIVSSVTGIPPSMLGISTDNPSSAEAMRVAKDRLISRAERKAAAFGDALEKVMRIALALYGKLPEDGAITLEAQWRNPATASESARMAQMLQAHAQGIIGAETAREFLQLTPEQLARERSTGTSQFAHQLGA